MFTKGNKRGNIWLTPVFEPGSFAFGLTVLTFALHEYAPGCSSFRATLVLIPAWAKVFLFLSAWQMFVWKFLTRRSLKGFRGSAIAKILLQIQNNWNPARILTGLSEIIGCGTVVAPNHIFSVIFKKDSEKILFCNGLFIIIVFVLWIAFHLQSNFTMLPMTGC